MMPSFFNGLALFFYMLCTWLLFFYYLPCLADCIKFFSWEQCEESSVETVLTITAIHGLSGFLWVSGNYREYPILYNWVIVTAQLIVLTFTYIIYANILVGWHIWQWHLICCGILVGGFVLVLLYLMESKKVIANPWIKNLLKALTVPDGKVQW